MTRGGWHAARFTEDPNKALVHCAECGRSMWLPKSKVAMYRRCGPACWAVHHARRREARRRECETCGRIFYPRLAQLKAGRGRFCSQACNAAGRAALQTPTVIALAAERMRELRRQGLVRYSRGPAHPSWKGGKLASKKRRVESGKAAAELRRYRKLNPDKARQFAQSRARRKFGRLPRGTVKRIGIAQRWLCAICRRSLRAVRYHVDHIRPLARGGQHIPANIQLLCPTCNVRKGASDPIDFMPRARGVIMRADGSRPADADVPAMMAGTFDFRGYRHFSDVGKKAAGRLLDGREWSEFPT